MDSTVAAITALAVLFFDLLTCEVEFRVQALRAKHTSLLDFFPVKQAAELSSIGSVGGDGQGLALITTGAYDIRIVAC